jgi:PA domain/Secretion system C-terminal sorting domain
MKKNLLLIFICLLITSIGYSQFKKTNKNKTTKFEKKNLVYKSQKPTKEITLLRKKHAAFLKNSPYSKTLKLSEEEREEAGIPPNKYYESEWELTMSPSQGRPITENLDLVRKDLEAKRQQALLSRTPGDANDNNWVERGPTNVGGRTRAVMFDPNDATNETAYAGGVSGGLWKNTNISNPNSVWTRVNIPENLAVSCMTYDPNNTNIFYVGTGESYVGGDANGDGLWKSTNGGSTFFKVFGGTGPTVFQAGTMTIAVPAALAGSVTFLTTTGFGTQITANLPVSGSVGVVLVDDGTAAGSEACSALTPANATAMNGKIALIRRGTCAFVIKVKNAQDAGAIGVIMINNTPGNPIAMGGTDATITIPSGMVSQTVGNQLVAALTPGPLNVVLNPDAPGSFSGTIVTGKQHINAVKVRNNAGLSEVYVAVGDVNYNISGANIGGSSYGLYKSVDGTNFNEISMPLTANNRKHSPNDIEIGADNKVWVSTTNSAIFGVGGGKVFSSTDGITFTQKFVVPNGRRTEIAVSKTNANKIYILAELPGLSPESTIIKTTDGFATTTTIALPVDVDTATRMAVGFTGEQSSYDLLLAINPANDENIYVGGIDLFKTVDGGTSWSQISHWYGLSGYSNVHSDQHALTFANNNSNTLLFGNDGGVFYSPDASASILSRNLGFNVTQFYSVAVAPTTNGMTGDNFVAGAQDNGSQMFLNAVPGAGASNEVQGGDGAICLFNQNTGTNDRYRITNYVYNNSVNLFNYATNQTRVINSESTVAGAFISPMALDSKLNILYSDYSVSTPAVVYQVRRYTNLKTGTVAKVNLTNALLTNSPTALAVSKYTTTATVLLVGTRNGKLLRITNADKLTTSATPPVWSDITSPTFIGSVSDVEFGRTQGEIFVTFHNYNVPSIWYTNDGGTTWEDKEGNLPDIPVKCILQNPLNPNEVIIGTDLGVWYTNNFDAVTPIWNQSYNGMSNVKVTDLDVRNDNAVYASTYGRGVFSGVFTATSLATNSFGNNNNSIKIYPNPTNGIFNLKINQFVGKVKIQVTDLNGRLIKDINDDNFNIEKTIDLSGFQSGVYLVKVTSDEANFTQKIIKN